MSYHLTHPQGPVLYHCSGGKDRTGWGSTMLSSITGVLPATNAYTADWINTQLALNVDSISLTPSALVELHLDLDAHQLGGWRLRPWAMIGYERLLDSAGPTKHRLTVQLFPEPGVGL